LLTELTIDDFAIIDHLELRFSPGFNVLTGETGAGKSIIVDAVGLLLGGRADATVIRSNAEEARVEGVFHLSSQLQAAIRPLLAAEKLEGDSPDLLILGREIRHGGRSICRVNGRAVTLTILEEISRPLIDIHGQSEHLSLLRAREQLNFLDRYGDLWPLRERVAAGTRELRQVRKELAVLLQDERELARRVDRLEYQIGEITAARLRSGEEEELKAERTRLSNAEQLMALTNEAYQTLYEGGEEQLSAADLLGQVTRALADLERIDGELAEQKNMAEAIADQVADLAHGLRDYRDSVEYDPERLAWVEERLGLIHDLKRKYGDSIEEVLAFAEAARRELGTISHSEERIEELRAEEERLLHSVGEVAAELSAARRQVGERLAEVVEKELADLGMEKTRFTARLSQSQAEDGVYVPPAYAGDGDGERLACDERGIDRVEFLIAPNVGEELKPLSKVASGGETSRLMLALKTVLSTADATPTLIFDEIDQGIGGRMGGVVGRKLWHLTPAHQVLCVTHLPQIAGYGDAHYKVQKGEKDGRTVTGVQPLSAGQRPEELAQMLGRPSAGTRRSAHEILDEVSRHKENSTAAM
jgi:DNA repair protein RecN (Recombination protein N)